jgi:hypothetical protein
MVDKNSSVFIACRPTGIIAILLAFCIAILLSNNASAAIVNGGFETGDLTGWTTSGHAWVASDNPYSFKEGSYSGAVGLYDGSAWMYQDVSVSGNMLLNLSKRDDTGFSWIYVYELSDGEIVSTIYNSQSNTPVFHSIDVEGYDDIRIYFLNTHVLGTSWIDGICLVGAAAAPEFDDVSWDQDPYFAYDTANITTNIVDFDDTTYSYYLDLYSEQEYLTTYPIHSETESNYYTFPVSSVDTGLLAELQRVTEPYGTNEVNLARDLSHFEAAAATSIGFNKSSYAPGESLSVMWTGAPTGSTVWLWCGADGYVIENDVSYSDSLSFDIPSDSEESYYIVDVIINGIIIATDSCEIFSIPDYVFDRNVSVDQDEYVHGDWVTVTYSTDTPAVIKVFDDTNADIWHYLDVPVAVTNETWMYYIGDTDPYGSFSVLFGNDNFLVSDYYSVVSSTSFVQVVPESMYMYETMRIWYITNGSSTLSVTDSSDSILLQQTVNSSSLESISYIPTVSGILTITLSDVPADATDSIIVYWADDPDDVPDEDDIEEDVIEDVLGDDETMTEYYNEKFRDFAPTIWGFFMLMCLLFLMSILTSFNSGDKRR